jgi:hypothetical protein
VDVAVFWRVGQDGKWLENGLESAAKNMHRIFFAALIFCRRMAGIAGELSEGFGREAKAVQ